MRAASVLAPIAAVIAGAGTAALLTASSDPAAPAGVVGAGGADRPVAPGTLAQDGPVAVDADPAESVAIDIRALAAAADPGVGLAAWARRDPAGFMTALASDEPVLRRLVATAGLRALRLAGEADPLRMLALAETLAGPLRRQTLSAALEALAAREPDSAVAYLDGIENREERDAYLAAVAAGYARASPDAAVAWLETLGEADGAAFYPVIREIAAVDLMQAIELDEWAMALDYGGADFGASDWFFLSLGTGRENLLRLADRLLGNPSQGLLASVMEQWAYQDPYGAIAWIQGQERVSSLVVAGVAEVLAGHDFRAALRHADQLTGEIREIWLESVFETAAFFDTREALRLLDDYRTEPFHAETRDAVIWRAISTLGPGRAAALAGPEPSESLATRIGIGWARFEPLGALDWARSLAEPSTRSTVLAAIVRSWLVNDPDAANAWVGALSDPALRAEMRAIVCRSPAVVCSALL